MLVKLPDVLAQISVFTAAWLGASTAIWKFFGYIDEVSSKEFRDKVYSWIESINLKVDETKFINVSREIFLKFFGEKHFSKKCILRSILFTIIIQLILYLIYIASDFKESVNSFNLDLKGASPLGILILIMFYLAIYIPSLLQDYIALYKTRYLLGNNLPLKLRSPFIIILIDLVISLVLNIGIIYLINFLVLLWAFFFMGDGQGDWRLIFHPNVSIRNLGVASGALWLCASMYFGTLWVFMIHCSGVVTAISLQLSRSFIFLRSIVDIRKKPIKSLATFLIIALTILYLLILPFLILNFGR